MSNRELRKRKATTRFKAHPSTESPQHQDYCLVFRRAERPRGRISPKETETETDRARWAKGTARSASRETHSQALIPLSHTGRGAQAAGPAVHPSFVLPRSDRGLAPTPAPHSHSLPEPGPGHGRTCDSYQKRNLQPAAHRLTQPPSFRESISAEAPAEASKESRALPAPAATGAGGAGQTPRPGHSLILELRAPRGACTCLAYFAPSGAED